jgi:hypothetical protein
MVDLTACAGSASWTAPVMNTTPVPGTVGMIESTMLTARATAPLGS